MTTDKESNGMLNLVTLEITDKEVQKEYKQLKVKVYFEWADVGIIVVVALLVRIALDYWVYKRVNMP